MTVDTSIALQHALYMAEQGYQLWPCRIKWKQNEKGEYKKDLGGLPNHWTEGGLTNAEDIKAQWLTVQATGYLIACGPSRITVVDTDVKNGIDGNENYLAVGGVNEAGFIVRTWSGGLHRYYQSTGTGNSTGNPPGVDVKGIGGGVFGPGSIVVDQKGEYLGHYEVNAGFAQMYALSPEPSNLAQITEAPKWAPKKTQNVVEGDAFLIDQLRRYPPMTVSRARQAVANKVNEIRTMKNEPSSGMRYRIMGAAMLLTGVMHADLGYDYDEAKQALMDACRQAYGDVWDEDERWIDSGLDDGLNQPIPVYPDPLPPEQADPLGLSGVPAGDTRSFESLLVDASELDGLPDPEPLIDRWLFKDTTARLIGQPGSYKSFVAIDMACCVALGIPWHGSAVDQTTVLYVVGEGLSGYKRRISAWCKANDVDKSALQGRLILTRGAVQIGSDMWNQLTAWVEQKGVKFIIGDTQSKMTIESEENSNDDAKRDHAHLDALRMRTGATLLLLHHTGHPEGDAGRRGRGASTWRGAVDTELMMTKVGERKSNLLCDRHKESESGFEVGVELYPIAESLAVRVLQEPTKTELMAWVEQQVAGNVYFGSQSELVQAARLANLTVSNADKRTIYEKYKQMFMSMGVMNTMGVVDPVAQTVPARGGLQW